MRVVERIDEARAEIAAAREALRARRDGEGLGEAEGAVGARGARIALVPTMGFLHEGHLRLVDEARRRCDYVVLSLFVNPLQFGPREDLDRYPRDRDGDVAKSRDRGVDLIFAPTLSSMYPGPRRILVSPMALAERWEGASRPGHFAGVLTVVAKLFNIVQPSEAFFGQKDIQQATLVRAMVSDLDYPVEIIVAPTVREPDGLALSSRNSLLGAEDRIRAVVLSRALGAMTVAFNAGERDARALERQGHAILSTEPATRVDYLAVVDPVSLESVATAFAGSIVVVAAAVGGTRLIDNVVLGES